VKDLTWFAPDSGRPKWDDASLRTLCYQLDASEDEADLGVERLCFILNSHFPLRSSMGETASAWVRPGLASGQKHVLTHPMT